MPKRIYVGNLPFSYSEDKLAVLFSDFGTVVNVVFDTNPKMEKASGFGFVEMADTSKVNEIIKALNGKNIIGNNIEVGSSLPRIEKMVKQSGLTIKDTEP